MAKAESGLAVGSMGEDFYRLANQNMKKYHVHALAKIEYTFEVEADSEQEAMARLQKAIDQGDESKFECETFDTGTLEVLEAHDGIEV